MAKLADRLGPGGSGRQQEGFLQCISGLAATGAVAALFGRGSGVVTGGDVFVHQNTPGLGGTNQAGDEFGWSVGS